MNTDICVRVEIGLHKKQYTKGRLNSDHNIAGDVITEEPIMIITEEQMTSYNM